MITMSDQLLVETYKASLPQKTLWPEYDAVMRAASFQSVSPEFDKAAVGNANIVLILKVMQLKMKTHKSCATPAFV